MGASEILRQIAPGQVGTIIQGSGNWREVHCERVAEDSLQLAIVRDQGDGTISFSSKVQLQTIIEGGVARIEGTLAAIDSRNLLLGLKFTPAGDGIQVINRRQAFRVAVSLKAKLLMTSRNGDDAKEEVWNCLIKDLSVGGAKMAVQHPAPHVHGLAILALSLPTEDHPLHIPCRVIMAQPGRNPPPLDTIVRIAYRDIPARVESKLFRYINWVQLDMIKRGVR